MSQRFGSRQRFALDLCGPYACDEIQETSVPCYLELGRTRVAVNLPAELVERCRAVKPSFVLRLPGDRTVPVETARLLTEEERQTANGWSAEMADFDRF
ncbi:MAG TPA: hypothetical protein VFI31_17665 [Pirellulales bacterium]|nr:hypothetical protein [Pirellulales bacterium]